jgi:hypothetical protein
MISYAALKEICGAVKSLAEFVGWMAAATFFVYKIGSGYLISGLSVKVRCRSINIKGQNCVSVSATLKKGNIGTTQLHDAMIVIRDWSDGAMIGQPTRFLNIRRWARVDLSSPSLEVDPGKVSRTVPFLNCAPGDEMQLAGIAILPRWRSVSCRSDCRG